MENIKAYLTDPDTGEITGKLSEGDRITRANSKQFLNETLNIPCAQFVKLNSSELTAVLPTLSHMEKVALISLAPYISYRSCCLQYSNGKDINLEAITKITGLSESAASKAVEGLISRDIFYKGRNSKNNQYFVNPWIANRGMVVNKVLKQMFKNYKVQSMGGVKWNDLPDYR